jgi:hypothetical protein
MKETIMRFFADVIKFAKIDIGQSEKGGGEVPPDSKYISIGFFGKVIL